jgi:hypothetical protein
MTIVSGSLRNSRADSRIIYQHGTDVNVLIERRIAMENTQSQHRPTVREKNGGLTQLRAPGGRTGALLSNNIDRAVESLHALFSDYTGGLQNGIKFTWNSAY